MSELDNTGAIKEMLVGQWKAQTTQTHNLPKQKEFVKRQVGDTWEDENGVKWIQKDGYAMRLPKTELMNNTFVNCLHPKCECQKPTHVDEDTRKVWGMCVNCVSEVDTWIPEETKKNLVRYISHQNYYNRLAEATIKHANLTDEAKKMYDKGGIQFMGSDGKVQENWLPDVSLEDLLLQIDEDFSNYCEELSSNFTIDIDFPDMEDFYDNHVKDGYDGTIQKLKSFHANESNIINSKNDPA